MDNKSVSDILLHTHPEAEWTVLGCSAEAIAPDRAEMVELLMCLARQMRDRNGCKTFYQLPPALADLFVQVFQNPEPLSAARELLYGGYHERQLQGGG